MKKLILLFFFFTALFAKCDTSNYNSAYKDYYSNQQIYIESLLDNNTQREISALKDIIKCGKYLNFDVREYEQKLKKLTSTNKKTQKKAPVKKPAPKKTSKTSQKTKTVQKKTTKPTVKHKTKTIVKQKPKPIPKNSLFKSKYSKYIKIHSTNPLKITIPNENIKVFTLKGKNYYKKVIDLKNAITPKSIKKQLGNVTLRIAQFDKNTVRIVYSAKKPFYFKYSVKNRLLQTYLKNTKTPRLFLPTKPKRKKIIVIDPGHGGKDVGGIGIGRVYEKNAVLKIAKYLKYYLQKEGYRVYMTRDRDIFIPLKKRTHFANQKKADLFISIHCNIAPKRLKNIRGIETYFLSPTRNERAIRVARLENKEIKGLNYLDQRVILNFLNRDRIINSNKLAIDIQNGMLRTLRAKYAGVRDGGVRPAPFWVLVGTQMPAILIEAGYLTNPVEAKRLFSPTYQRNLAKGIARGIESYFKKNY